ncbi:MAG TPA: PAS domain S-box protein [Bacteroidota bacterium]|nr:PAS domain S-box protein [Bacteroidota bacterium]
MSIQTFVRQYLMPPHFEDEEKNLVAGIFITTAIATFASLCFWLMYHMPAGQPSLLPPIILLAIIALLSIAFFRKGFLSLSVIMLLWALLGFLDYMAVKNDGVHDTVVFALPAVLVVAALMLKRRHFVLFGFVSLSSIIAVGYLEIIGVIKNGYSQSTNPLDIIDLALIFTITAVALRWLSENFIRTLARERNAEREIKKHASQLIESEQRYRTLFEGADDAIFIASTDVFIDCNKTALSIFGCEDRSEIIGHSSWELSPPRQPDGRDSKEKAVELIRAAIEGSPQHFYWKNCRKNGTAFDAEISLSRFEMGGQILVQTIVRDITERKLAEDALRISEERYRMLYEDNPCMYLTVDSHGTLISVNRHGANKLGYSTDELVGQSGLNVIHPDDREVVRQHISSSMQNPLQVVHSEYRKVCKDGAIMCVRESARAVTNVTGKQEILIVCEDITELKRMEMIIKRSEELYRTIFENTGTAMIVIEEDMLISLANTEAVHLSGYTREEIVGKKYSTEFVVKEDQEQLVLQHRLRIRNQDAALRQREFHITTKSGDIRNVFLTASIIPGTKKTVVSLQDITEQKRAEEALRQAQKLESIGTLAGGIAHDFNNVLLGIIGYTEMSLRFAERNSRLEKNLLKILKATDRATHLIEQILTFSRKTNPQTSIISLRPIIKEVLDLLKASIPSSVVIDFDLEKTSKSVLADPTDIHEVLLNLATNAVHAMNRKGTLTIRLYEKDLDQIIYGLSGNIGPGEYLVIEVADTGRGMDATTLSKAFEPFFTTKPLGEGTGLGLSVVLGVVQSVGGNIQVESEVGHGTTFKLFFPVTRQSSSVATNDDAVLQFPGTERILFVDDEQMLTEMVEELLTPLGYRVVGISDSAFALEFLKENIMNIDVLITDQTMPNLSGIELAEEALKIRRDLPVILCTGFSDEANPKMVGDVGVRQFLTKPFRTYELSKAIREVIDHRNQELLDAKNTGNR